MIEMFTSFFVEHSSWLSVDIFLAEESTNKLPIYGERFTAALIHIFLLHCLHLCHKTLCSYNMSMMCFNFDHWSQLATMNAALKGHHVV